MALTPRKLLTPCLLVVLSLVVCSRLSAVTAAKGQPGDDEQTNGRHVLRGHSSSRSLLQTKTIKRSPPPARRPPSPRRSPPLASPPRSPSVPSPPIAAPPPAQLTIPLARPPSPYPSIPLPQPPPAPQPIVSASDDSKQFPGGNCVDVKEAFEVTNRYRARHQAPPLQWSESLGRESTAWAKVLAAQGCPLTHGSYGENLMQKFFFPASEASESCLDSVQGWYQQVYKYNFDAKRPFADNWENFIGHFSQLVWASSSSVGCGVAIGNVTVKILGTDYRGGCRIVVCRYKSFGNSPNDDVFRFNVLRNISAIEI